MYYTSGINSTAVQGGLHEGGCYMLERDWPPGDRVAWPFYIVCDVSESMHGKRMRRAGDLTPYEAMQEALLELVDFADQNVEAADIAHLSLLTFADEAEVALPLRKMSDGLEIGTLPKGIYTNYAKIFATLCDVIDTDLRQLEGRNLMVKRPTVFFITDGQPVEDGKEQPRELWEPPLRRLHSFSATRPEGRNVHIAVIALGFEGANSQTLQMVAKTPGVACIAEAGVASPHELMSKLMTSILDSVTNSAVAGDLVFSPPRGMALCD